MVSSAAHSQQQTYRAMLKSAQSFVSKLYLCLPWCRPQAYEIKFPLTVSDCSHASAPDIQGLELSKASCSCIALCLHIGGVGDRLQSILVIVIDATFEATHICYSLLHVMYQGLWSWDTICSVCTVGMIFPDVSKIHQLCKDAYHVRLLGHAHSLGVAFSQPEFLAVTTFTQYRLAGSCSPPASIA